MPSSKYSRDVPFPYASGMFMVFPKGFEKGRDLEGGSLHIADDYIIYFKAGTPDDIKQRLIKDYADYCKNVLEHEMLSD